MTGRWSAAIAGLALLALAASAQAQPADSTAYLTINVAISDTDLQPAAIFVPAGRPIQLTLRNRGSQEHHFRVVDMKPDDLQWMDRTLAAATGEDDDHSAHHDRRLVRSRAVSPAGIRPSGKEVHAYVAVPGDVDIVLFSTIHVGTFVIRCDLHDEPLGTLQVFDAGGADSSTTVSPAQRRALARALTRNMGTVAASATLGVEVEATFATADYVRQSLGGADALDALRPDEYAAFLLTERTHTATLPQRPIEPALVVDGRAMARLDARIVTDSVHHRATIYRFARQPGLDQGHHVVTLRLPSGAEATWHLPLVTPVRSAGASALPFDLGEQWGLILALLGGMVAAMWPCLFQLTVYFIPALAGVAMRDTSGEDTRDKRRQILGAAFYFILGFTIVYTATGALIGFVTQQLGDNAQFEVWQRYVSVAAGIIVIALSLRVAAKVRAPLVCRMPILSGMARSKRRATRLEMMLAGLAFATGCMTCFGSALVVGMVVYVGLAQSALYGAVILFLFSLGMGIPLVLAALAMARALPMLMKLERAVPWMGLASATLMAGFGVLLISGNYMLVSEWTFRMIDRTPTAAAPAPWLPPAAGSVRALPTLSLPPGHSVADLQVAAVDQSMTIVWLDSNSRTIQAVSSDDRGRHFSAPRIVAELDGERPGSGHLRVQVAPGTNSTRSWLSPDDSLMRVTWTPLSGSSQTWQSVGSGPFQLVARAPLSDGSATTAAFSSGVNTWDPWRTTVVEQGPQLKVAGLVDAWDRPVSPQSIQRPSRNDVLRFLGVDVAGNPFGIWMSREGSLTLQRHPNADHQQSLGTDLPLPLKARVSQTSRVAAAATDWGVVTAWVDVQDGRTSISLREVSFDELCAPQKALATSDSTDRS
ncbi:MAG: cytochrome c biogenesis protein CcdA [Vicinamibacterales bacterium]